MAAGQTLEVDAYDRDAKTKLAQGSLTTLDNQIDPTTGTLKLRATFDNAKSTLFPNQFVNARLLVQEKHGVTLVPTAAVQRNSQATYVYVVKTDSTVTVRPDHHRHDGRRRLGSDVGVDAGRSRGDDRRRQTAGREQGQRSAIVLEPGVLEPGVRARRPQARRPRDWPVRP